MPSQTTYAQLYMYNNTTDREELFMNFRDKLAGTGSDSNMQKIDRLLSNMNDSIVALQSTPDTLTIKASGTGNNFTATITGFTAFQTDGLVLIYLPENNIGTAAISVNGGAAVSLMKIGPTGNIVNLDAADMKKNVGYLFQFDGLRLLLIGETFKDVVTSSTEPTNQVTGGLWLKPAAGGGVDTFIKESDGSYSTVSVKTGTQFIATGLSGSGNETLSGWISNTDTTIGGHTTSISSLDQKVVKLAGPFSINPAAGGDTFAFNDDDGTGYNGSKSAAGLHNSIYRGKNLGTAITAAQYASIAAGTFDDMYIGDYWVISYGGSSYNMRIAAFDYYYKTGDTDGYDGNNSSGCNEHHVVCVPDTSLTSYAMSSDGLTSAAYAGTPPEGVTQMRDSKNSFNFTTDTYSNPVGLGLAKAIICYGFAGSTAYANAKTWAANHLLIYKALLATSATNGVTGTATWLLADVELMTEQNVCGGKFVGNGVVPSIGIPYIYTVDKSQYPLFAFNPFLQSNRQTYWLRDVVSSNAFARIIAAGTADPGYAPHSLDVRPSFCIK